MSDTPPIPALLEKVVFEGTPADVGRAHGQLWASEIKALAELRTTLTFGKSDIEANEDLARLARAHLPVLEAFDGALHAELLASAEGAGMSPEELVILNHYTDIRDIRAPVWGPLVDPGGCSMALLPGGATGPAVSGQTWDMHGSAMPFVRLVEFRVEGTPAATLLTLTGCLGMAGINAHGVAVLINNLTSTDARVGVVWSALVRRMLRERTVEGAVQVLRAAPLGSGHHYLVTDGLEAVSIETSGQLKRELARGTTARLLHTNHCLIDDLKAVERVPEGSTTWVRFGHLERRVDRLAAGRIGAEELARAFADHEGYPKSLCIHMTRPPGASPHAVDTCAAVVFDHAARRMLAVQGCAVDGAWVATRPGEDGIEALSLAHDTDGYSR